MVYHFHGNPSRLGLGKGSGGVAIQRFPGFLVDFGFEGGFQGFVRVIRAEEVGVADEEAFFVVVGVDEPAGDAVGAVAADFSGVGVEDVYAVDFDLNFVVFGVENVDIRFAEDDEEVAFACVFEVVGHVQVGVHSGFEHGDATQFAELGGMGVVVEGASVGPSTTLRMLVALVIATNCHEDKHSPCTHLEQPTLLTFVM